MDKEETKIYWDLVDFFAGHALSGYIRGGLSLMNRDEECTDVAEACFHMGITFVKVRQEIIKKVESQMLQDTTK